MVLQNLYGNLEVVRSESTLYNICQYNMHGSCHDCAEAATSTHAVETIPGDKALLEINLSVI